MNYKIVSLIDEPEMKGRLAEWFSQKWCIPIEAYLDSMDACLSRRSAVPQWYAAVADGRIIGGVGVIENDFHDRPDLSPNVCAVYTEPDCRGSGVAGALLSHACRDMSARGVDTLYLLTDHVGFYERYGWEYFCQAHSDGEERASRMYVHREGARSQSSQNA